VKLYCGDLKQSWAPFKKYGVKGNILGRDPFVTVVDTSGRREAFGDGISLSFNSSARRTLPIRGPILYDWLLRW